MLEFDQNDNKVKVNPIYEKGRIGQMVIYGKHVYWGEKPDLIKYPLSKYSCPSIFIIVEKHEGYYILNDTNDNCIKLQYDCGTQFLYDAQEWLNWNSMREKEEFFYNQIIIRQKESDINLLKDIIIKQRALDITEDEAKELSLN